MKKEIKRLFFGLFLATPMLVAGSALAHGHKNPAGFVKRFDANKNGKVELSELPEKARERMKAADANGDGAVSESEITTFHEAKKKERIAKFDANKDGKLDDQERASMKSARAKEHFQRLDKDGNGSLTEQEVGDKKWARLGIADADKNGAVTAAELDAARASGKLPRGHRGKR